MGTPSPALRLVNLHGEEGRKEQLNLLHQEGAREIGKAMGYLARAIDGTPAPELGFQHVRRLPAKGGRYVVFSDHHFTFSGHRTNFFGQAGNREIYIEALDEYRKAGFTVIENGDVEDLVLFEPDQAPEEIALRKCMNLPQLEARRLEARLGQLRRILDDRANAPLIEAYRKLDETKQLIRIAGNHDYDNQRPQFFAELQKRFTNLSLPSDILLLNREDGSTAFALMHGHQFDIATNPVSAPRFGETISETLGLYFQGPDRTWRWDSDDVGLWASGKQPFLDNLALNQRALKQSINDRWRGDRAPLTYDVDLNPGGARSAIGTLFEDYQGELFESLFKQTIAWHYFKNKSPIDAYKKEVLSGERFFKYQLLDETWIKSEILRQFPDEAKRPTLVLGHTHEVRMNPLDPKEGKPFPWYLNSGSAGRFERLIWGIEIVDGQASLISYSRPPGSTGRSERRVWHTNQENNNAWVRAEPTPSAIPKSNILSSLSSSATDH